MTLADLRNLRNVALPTPVPRKTGCWDKPTPPEDEDAIAAAEATEYNRLTTD